MGIRTVLALILWLLAAGQAAAFEAKLSPDEIRPGDPFVLKVRSNPARPEAEVEGRALAFGSCGEGCYVALGALGVETSPGRYEVSVTAGGETKTLAVTVREGEFKTQQLTLPEDKVFLSPEARRRAVREAEKMAALWEAASPEAYWDGAFIMPLDNDFSTEFGVRRIMNGKKKSVHRGVDIRGKEGEPVLAANAGRVVMAEDTFYGGNTIVIDHGLGVHTVYMHLSKFSVEEGEHISKGNVVGYVGSTGRATGPHLHYGVKINAVTANPVSVSRLPL
jgi:murein DD-endopeptidase MepM/ murein hydrolase activator NlpD